MHLDDRGESQLSDREIVTRARAESRILVAHDLDFTDLIAVSRAQIWWLDLFLPRLAWAYSRNQRRR